MKVTMNDELRAAARLMEQGEYAQAADAYARIASLQPQNAALCFSQVGAALFFLGRFGEAIDWYRKAEQHGFPAEAIADNIREAEQAMRQHEPSGRDTAPVDFAPVIAAALTSRALKRILVPPLPPKKERNARGALPVHVRDVAIHGLVDLTLLGSAKNALVFTANDCFIVDDDQSWQFAWRELIAVDGFTNFAQDTIGLQLTTGSRKLYAASAASEVLPFLQAIAAANAGMAAGPQQVSAGGSVMLRHSEAAPSSLHDVAHADDERLASHLERALGPSGFVWHEIISDRIHLDVHMTPPTDARPFYVLVTSGMSARPMNVPNEMPGCENWRFAELCLLLPPRWPITQEAFADEANYWPIRLLKELARFPHDFNTWLGNGHSIPNGNPPTPYAPGIPFTGAVLIPPLPLGPQFFTVPGDPAIHIFQVLPVTGREMQLKLDLGLDEALARIERICPDFYGPLNVYRKTA